LSKGGAVTKNIQLLLVEDEPMILLNVEESLVEGGFEVTTALNGREAIARLEEHSDGVAGLITDVRLGGDIDGWDVARRARELDPGVAVIYMTGDSAADWASQGVPNSLLVQKPFAHAQLVTAISTLLTQSDSSLGK
jgi:DNA-binding response OmpR family regulator